MVRFGDGLKVAPKRQWDQKLVAMLENSPLTSVPIVTMTLNAAIEMKNAIIAYSIAVAPPRSRFSWLSTECMSIVIPSLPDEHGAATVDV
jgi:hypothetical protein